MKVIFACVHNAGRSQMAAAFFNLLAGSGGISAGTQPGEHVHPEVLQVMKEEGIDLSNARPQLLTAELAREANLLVTMGCTETCPFVPGLKREDWPLKDPKGKHLDEVRQIRDEIKSRVKELLSLQNEIHGGLVVETADSNDKSAIEQLLIENELPVPGCDDKPVRFLAARMKEELIGCLGWESYGDKVLLRSLAVRQSEQRKGIGSKLVNAAISELAADGVKQFYLLTNTASAFANQFGFKMIERSLVPEELSTSKQVVTDCCVTAQCMQLCLEA